MKAKLIDFESAFLFGALNLIIFMESQKEIKEKIKIVLQLKKPLYGLVQSVRHFSSSSRIHAEQCVKVNDVIHANDRYTIGSDEALPVGVKLNENMGLKIMVETNAYDYISCQIVFDKERK
jgi:hypothetical protein